MHFPEMLLMECEGCKKGKNYKQFRKGKKGAQHTEMAING